MAMLRVRIVDKLGSGEGGDEVELADDVSIAQLFARLLPALNIGYSPADFRVQVWRTGRLLGLSETLHSAGVWSGDDLCLVSSPLNWLVERGWGLRCEIHNEKD